MTLYVVRVMGFDMCDTSTGWIVLSIWCTENAAKVEAERFTVGVDILPVPLDTPAADVEVR